MNNIARNNTVFIDGICWVQVHCTKQCWVHLHHTNVHCKQYNFTLDSTELGYANTSYTACNHIMYETACRYWEVFPLIEYTTIFIALYTKEECFERKCKVKCVGRQVNMSWRETLSMTDCMSDFLLGLPYSRVDHCSGLILRPASMAILMIWASCSRRSDS